MNILVLNAGSASLKFEVIATPELASASDKQRKLVSGIIEGIGKEATFSLRENRQTIEQEEIAASNYSEATRHVLKWLDKSHWRDESTAQRLDAVGHRIVHGGETFTEPIVIDGDVIAGIENLEDLAPLHNIPALECIRTTRDVLRNEMPMIAVFDTVFHRTIPSRAAI